jgi:lipid A disaccharide synthetase
MISCGEASGDLYAAGLVSSLRQLEPEVDVFGFGKMRGATYPPDSEALAKTGG